MKKINLKQHNNRSGSLVENTLPQIFQKAKHFFISKSKPGVVRGNHYHKHKKEWLYVLSGRAKIYLYDLKTKKVTVFSVDEKRPELIEIGTNLVHAVKNIGKKEMIILAIINEKFNPKKPDTFYYDIGLKSSPMGRGLNGKKN